MSSGGKSRGKKEEGKNEKSEWRSVEGVSSKGSITDPGELCIDEKVLVDPKSLFIGSKIGEGAHGKVYQGRFVPNSWLLDCFEVCFLFIVFMVDIVELNAKL